MLVPEGDSTNYAELEASGTSISRRLRTAITVNPGMSYLLTERLSTSVGYGFNMVDYQSQAYNNYKGQTLSHGFDYLLNEKTTLLSRLTGSYYKYDETSNTKDRPGRHKSASAIDMRKNGIYLSWVGRISVESRPMLEC